MNLFTKILFVPQLTIATTHGVEPKELSKILFSVAETLVDNEQYEEALKYYEKELDVCEQPNEVKTDVVVIYYQRSWLS